MARLQNVDVGHDCKHNTLAICCEYVATDCDIGTTWCEETPADAGLKSKKGNQIPIQPCSLGERTTNCMYQSVDGNADSVLSTHLPASRRLERRVNASYRFRGLSVTLKVGAVADSGPGTVALHGRLDVESLAAFAGIAAGLPRGSRCDLTELKSADDVGVVVLAHLRDRGVQLVGVSPYLEMLLEHARGDPD